MEKLSSHTASLLHIKVGICKRAVSILDLEILNNGCDCSP